MKIVVKKENWIKYADVVGDYNPIHRNKKFAKNSKLEGIVAPGMWLVSHVQGCSKIQKAEFKFANFVYDRDLIQMQDYSFYNGENLACKGNVVFGEPDNENILLPKNIIHSQDFFASEKDIKKFSDSISFNGEGSNFEMYLMSCSAPTLLEYAKPKGLAGIHVYQSMNVHDFFDVNNISVHVSEEKIGNRMCKLNLYWESNCKIVATGESKVIPISI